MEEENIVWSIHIISPSLDNYQGIGKLLLVASYCSFCLICLLHLTFPLLKVINHFFVRFVRKPVGRSIASVCTSVASFPENLHYAKSTWIGGIVAILPPLGDDLFVVVKVLETTWDLGAALAFLVGFVHLPYVLKLLQAFVSGSQYPPYHLQYPASETSLVKYAVASISSVLWIACGWSVANGLVLFLVSSTSHAAFATCDQRCHQWRPLSTAAYMFIFSMCYTAIYYLSIWLARYLGFEVQFSGQMIVFYLLQQLQNKRVWRQHTICAFIPPYMTDENRRRFQHNVVDPVQTGRQRYGLLLTCIRAYVLSLHFRPVKGLCEWFDVLVNVCYYLLHIRREVRRR